MANPKGIITRKDVIEDEALKWGEVYAESIKEAIKQNNVLVESVKELNKQIQAFKVANSQKDYITAKQAEALATQQAIDAIKKQELAEISADKIKRSAIATMEAERKAKQAVEDAEAKAQKTKEASVKLTIEERIQNEIKNKALKQEALERLGLISAYTKLNNARTESKNRLRDLIASETASTGEIKKARKEFENLDEKVKKADKAVGDFTKNVGNYPFKSLAGGIKDLVGAFGIGVSIGAFATIMKGAFETVKKFEQGLADLSALTGATGKDLDYLKNKAIDLGKSTSGGALAVVEAYKLIGSAKPELLDDVKALSQVTEATLTLSKAAEMEMPDAASALTDAMNQFGADASQAGVFVDALANGAKYGAAEIPQTAEALLKFGAVARSTNVNIKESTALIQLLAENGIKGADAGTALRNVLLKISAPDALPKEAQKSLKDLGISFALLKDKSVSVQEKFEALKPLLEDNGKLLKTFGFENVVTARNIIEHTDRLKDLTSKMGEFGTAEEQANIRMDTLQGDIDRMSSTYDSFALSVSKGSGAVTGFFRFFVQGATEALEGLIRLNSSWDELFDKAKNDGAKSGKKLYEERFNAMIGDKLSDEQRIKIRARLKEVNDEFAKASKELERESDKEKKESKKADLKNLKTERDELLKRLGTGDDLEVSRAIAVTASRQAKLIASELNKVSEHLKHSDDTSYILRLGISVKDLKKSKEELEKSLAEQNAIVEEHNKKQRASNIKVDLALPAKKTAEEETEEEKKAREKAERAAEKAARKREKALKDKLDAEKKASDALYELQKQRLEQKIKFNDEIASDDKEDDEVRIKALENSQQKQIELTELTKKHSLDADKFVLEKDKLNGNEKIRITEDTENKITDIKKKTQKEIDKINEFDPKLYEDDLKRNLSVIQIANETELAAENERYNKLRELGFKNDKEKERAAEEHERILFNIKKEGLIAQTKLQINNLTAELNAYELQSDGTKKSQDFILEKRAEVAKLSTKLIEAEGDFFNENEKKKEKIATEQVEQILSISSQALGQLADLSNAFSQGKIQEIDEEISKNDEYYAKQIELAGNDARQKDLIQKEQEKKRAELEKKKKQAQNEQAKIDKAVAIAQTTINTAIAVMKAFATGSYATAILAGVLGAIQLATIIATPIPKYKHGRKGGDKELAYVGDGGISEVIERKRGRIEITPATDTLVQLEAGDRVYSSIDEYLRLQKMALLTSIDIQGRKVSDFQATQHFDTYGKEMLEELKKNTRAIEKNKSNIHFHAPKIDIQHAVWASNNKNWNN